MTKTIIKTENISKIYHLYNDPIDRLKEALHPLRKKYHHDFYALKDLNFEVKKGETIGIIGKNGAGKSTLLKILTGVLTPSSGHYRVEGKVSSLLELGVGFNPELSGMENIYFNATILGYSKEQIDKKINDILEFADIGEFIHQPVKSYSSGMVVRVAFAVAINVDPDIFIIDEALAVGDLRFQQKCFRKLREFKEKGVTIIFVTHDTGTIINYCDRAIWLKDGSIFKDDSPDNVCKEYLSYMFYDTDTKKDILLKAENKENRKIKSKIQFDDSTSFSSFGEGSASIIGTALYSKDEEKIYTFEGGDLVDFYMKIKINEEIINPIIGFIITDEYGNKIIGTNSYLLNSKIRSCKKGDIIIAKFQFRLPYLKNGKYFFSPAIADGTLSNHIQHHWVHDAYIVNIASKDADASMGWYFVVKDANLEVDFN